MPARSDVWQRWLRRHWYLPRGTGTSSAPSWRLVACPGCVPIPFTYQHVLRTSAGFPITTIIMISTRQLFGAAGGAALLLDAR